MGTKQLGFYGLGTMGQHLAMHMHRYSQSRYGVPALIASRTSNKAKVLSEQGPEFRENFASLAADCDIIGMCLSTTKDVASVLTSTKLRPGTLIVDITSGEPAAMVELGKVLTGSDVRLVDAPVSGGPKGARSGTLVSMVGGLPKDLDEAEPIINAWSEKVIRCGPLGSGDAVKAVNNVLNAAHVLLASEGVLALKKYGVDPATALEVINSSSGMSLQTQRLPTYVLSRKFDFGFGLALMRKDCGIAKGLVDDLNTGATLIPEVYRLMQTAEAKYGGNIDYMRAANYLEELAGCELSPNSEDVG
mmetsp:Transcript_3987/g.5600  ORF Transcript_3987/g.5600 Transcript_3987/m.5600 type:complete len:304 (-) Transcript_3987:142-1053(-)